MMNAKRKPDLAVLGKALTKVGEAHADGRFVDKFEAAASIVARQPSGTASVDAGSAAEPVEVINVPISFVRDNPRNARKLYDPEVVKERAASIARHGQMVPALACVDWENPGRYILIGGHYRKRALLELGRTEIQLKLVKASTYLELARLSYIENEDRENGTPLDLALAFKELLDNGDVATQEELAEKFQLNRTKVTKLLQIPTLPASVLEILCERPRTFTQTIAYELTSLAELTSLHVLETLARRIINEDVSSRDLIQMRQDLQANKPPRKTKEISRQHKITRNGEQIGQIKDWDSGRVVLEVRIADPIARQQLVDELKVRMGVTADAQRLGTDQSTD